MPCVKKAISSLYDLFAQFPELAKFRNYQELWCWMLYNSTWKIEQQLKACNDELEKIQGFKGNLRINDYHLSTADEDYPELNQKVDVLERLVRRHTKDLLLFKNVKELPEPRKDFARIFATHEDIFEGGIYGPTGEAASMYREVPPGPYLSSVKSVEEHDLSTGFVIAHLGFIHKCLQKPIKWFLKKRDDDGSTRAQFVQLETIQTVIHWLTVVYVPVLLSTTLAVLSVLNSEMTRIVVLGAFGIVFAASLMLLVPLKTRNYFFSITAAFFSVGGIFIGTKGFDHT